MPDLLGFGRSLDESATDFDAAAHVDALDEVIDAEAPTGRVHIGAHSMGSAVALRWAAEHPERVERIVCIGAPIWPDQRAARKAIGAAGPMARALVLDTSFARALCRFNCRYRGLAGLVAAAVAPRWPAAIARQASLHTWEAYTSAIDEFVFSMQWGYALAELSAAGVEVHLIWGAEDPVGDRTFTADLASGLPGVSTEIVPDADHSLPAARPSLLPDHLTGARAAARTAMRPAVESSERHPRPGPVTSGDLQRSLVSSRRPMGSLEDTVMRHLWTRDEPATTSEVQAAVGDGLAYTTVMTILVRLWEKGQVERERVGRAYAYRPVHTEADHEARRPRRR